MRFEYELREQSSVIFKVCSIILPFTEKNRIMNLQIRTTPRRAVFVSKSNEAGRHLCLQDKPKETPSKEILHFPPKHTTSGKVTTHIIVSFCILRVSHQERNQILVLLHLFPVSLWLTWILLGIIVTWH